MRNPKVVQTAKLNKCDGNIRVEWLDSGSGQIASDLAEYFEVADTAKDKPLRAAIDVLEATILAMACAGINVKTAKFQDAIQTVLDKMANEYAD